MNLRADRKPLAIGHRGAAALAPENTLAALEAAADAGVDAIEFDVLRRPDGALLLAHSLHEQPDEALLLDDALAWFAPRAELLHVDVKGEGIEAEIVDALRRHGVAGRAFVSTTDAASLRRFAELEPELPRALTYPHDRRGLSRRRAAAPVIPAGLRALRSALPYRLPAMLREAQATVASLNDAVVSRAVVERCHAAGVPVVAWTVNEPRRVRELAALGVDAIVSDDPRMLAATLST